MRNKKQFENSEEAEKFFREFMKKDISRIESCGRNWVVLRAGLKSMNYSEEEILQILNEFKNLWMEYGWNLCNEGYAQKELKKENKKKLNTMFG